MIYLRLFEKSFCFLWIYILAGIRKLHTCQLELLGVCVTHYILLSWKVFQNSFFCLLKQNFGRAVYCCFHKLTSAETMPFSFNSSSGSQNTQTLFLTMLSYCITEPCFFSIWGPCCLACVLWFLMFWDDRNFKLDSITGRVVSSLNTFTTHL